MVQNGEVGYPEDRIAEARHVRCQAAITSDQRSSQDMFYKRAHQSKLDLFSASTITATPVTLV